MQLSSEGHFVEAMAVIRDNVINGGGGGYYCQGIISQEEKVIVGRVKIKKWDHNTHHALGLFKEVSMAVTGRYDLEKRCFDFRGQVNGHHVIGVQANGQWIAALA